MGKGKGHAATILGRATSGLPVKCVFPARNGVPLRGRD